MYDVLNITQIHGDDIYYQIIKTTHKITKDFTYSAVPHDSETGDVLNLFTIRKATELSMVIDWAKSQLG